MKCIMEMTCLHILGIYNLKGRKVIKLKKYLTLIVILLISLVWGIFELYIIEFNVIPFFGVIPFSKDEIILNRIKSFGEMELIGSYHSYIL